MHPGRDIARNSPREYVYRNPFEELLCYAEPRYLVGLDTDTNIRIQVGGAYCSSASVRTTDST